MQQIARSRAARWTAAVFFAVAALAAALYMGMNSRTFQFFGGIVNRANTQEKIVALTFDDGPSEKTGEILSILGAENVKATFFLVGQSIEKYPEQAKQIAAAGHQIGNHTYSHDRMVFQSITYIRSEIEKTDALIRGTGYQDGIQFRPPNGKKLFALPYYLWKNNRNTIIWDVEPNSFPEVNKSSEAIVSYVLEHAKPGSIILLHAMYDSAGTTVGAIRGIVEGLRKDGYTFVTVNELLSYNGK